MKAIVIDHCCKAEDLRITEIPIPQVRPGWVLVRVRALGLNHSEAILRMYEADNDYISTPIVPGIECVGQVADPSDSPFSAGDKVVALMGGMGRSFNGSYAEYALRPSRNVFRVAADLDWASLAAVAAGDSLLVRGATSTVGQAAIQLAKVLGAHVVAACRRETAFDRLKAIGADECVLDDGRISQKSFSCRPNKALELIGPKTLHDSLQTVRRPGCVCSTGVLGNVFTVNHFDPIKYIPNGVFLTGFYSNYPSQDTMDALFALLRRGRVKPLYSQVFSLEEMAQAHALLENGGAGGKIVILIGSEKQ